MICIALGSSAPTTIRSGRIKSSTAAPSLRNSGFDTTAKGVSAPRLRSSSATAPRTLSTVPVGPADTAPRAAAEELRKRDAAPPFARVATPEFLRHGAAAGAVSGPAAYQ